MKIIGYGEDALTYWALSKQMNAFLNQLNSSHQIVDAIFFRPSFGRKGLTEEIEGKKYVGPEFGEFDSILCTPTEIYLIETKWTKSSECKRGEIKLAKQQILRHKIMTAYINYWRSASEPALQTWKEFYEHHDGLLPYEDFVINMPPCTSRLARNLEHILRQLCSKQRKVSDVILFIRLWEKQTKPISKDNYIVAMIDCPCEVSGFVTLNDNGQTC